MSHYPLKTKGSLLTADGTKEKELTIGANDTVLTADSTAANGMAWKSVAGTGDVVGPAGAVADNFASFNGTSGKVIKDSGLNASSFQAPISVIGLVASNAGTLSGRTLTGPAAGISVTNGNGTAGNPTLALTNDLSALEALTTNGLAVRTATDTWTTRTITAGSSKVAVTNGGGVAGDPTVDVTEANLTLNNIGGTLGATKGGTSQSTYTTGDILYASAANTLSKLAAGSNGNILTLAAGIPSWAAAAASNSSIINTYNSSTTWSKNTNTKFCIVMMWSGGAGGGSGRKGSTGVSSGGSGGACGGYLIGVVPASIFASSETITIGAGGAGGVAQISANTSGNAGTVGGSSSIGTVMVCSGNVTDPGVGGSNSLVAGGNGYSWSINGHLIFANLLLLGGGSPVTKVGGTAGSTAVPMYYSDYSTGGGGGGGLNAGVATGSVGAGGSILAMDLTTTLLTGGAAGTNTTTGTAGGTGSNSLAAGFPRGATGGGGGGSGTTGNGGTGGVGGVPGGGGGGGGATSTGTQSGAGGAGGAGKIIIIEVM